MAHPTPRTLSATDGPPPGRLFATDPTAAAAGPADSEPAPPTAAFPSPGVPAAPEHAAEAVDPPTFQLSVTQLLATAAAAVTAAVLGSRLGVAGTLVGAGLASSVSMIAAAVYSHSMAAAAYRVKVARVHPEGVAESLPATSREWGQAPPTVAAVGAPVVAPTAAGERLRSPRSGSSRWWAAGLGVVAACALALLTVTGIEAIRGAPLSGGAAGGLSVLGGAPVGTPDTSPTTRRSPGGSENGGTAPDGAAAPDGGTDSAGDSSPVSDTSETAPATVTDAVTASPPAPSAGSVPDVPAGTGSAAAKAPTTTPTGPPDRAPTATSTSTASTSTSTSKSTSASTPTSGATGPGTSGAPGTTDGASGAATTPPAAPQTETPTPATTVPPADERGAAVG